MANELRELKQEHRELYYEQVDNEKVLIKKHEGLVIKN